jgi:hypothetical protein
MSAVHPNYEIGGLDVSYYQGDIQWAQTAALESLTFRGRALNRSGRKDGPGRGGVPATFEQPEYQDPMGGLNWAETAAEKSQAAFDEMLGSLNNLRNVGMQAGADIGASFGNVVYGLLTGAKAAESFGQSILKAIAGALASLAQMVAQLVIVKALFALFGGGAFMPFKGIGKLFGAAEGGVVAGSPGRDAVGPIMVTRGEGIVPSGTMARLSRFLSEGSGGGMAAAGGGGGVYNINVTTSSFVTESEKLSMARQIRDQIEQLSGKRR